MLLEDYIIDIPFLCVTNSRQEQNWRKNGERPDSTLSWGAKWAKCVTNGNSTLFTLLICSDLEQYLLLLGNLTFNFCETEFIFCAFKTCIVFLYKPIKEQHRQKLLCTNKQRTKRETVRWIGLQLGFKSGYEVIPCHSVWEQTRNINTKNNFSNSNFSPSR